MEDHEWPSAVWEHFERTIVDGRKFSQCKICAKNGQQCQIAGHSASNNKRHLQAVHLIKQADDTDKLKREDNPSEPSRLFAEIMRLDSEKRRKIDEIRDNDGQLPASVSGLSPPPAKIPRRSNVRTVEANEEDRKRQRVSQTCVNVRILRQKVADKNKQIELLKSQNADLDDLLSNGRFGALSSASTIRELPRITATDYALATSTMQITGVYQCVDVAESRLRPLEFERMHSVNMLVNTYLEIAHDLRRPGKPGLSQFDIEDREAEFINKIGATVPMWIFAETVWRYAQTHGDAVIRRLFNAISVVIGSLFSYYLGHTNCGLLKESLPSSNPLDKCLNHGLNREEEERAGAPHDAFITFRDLEKASAVALQLLSDRTCYSVSSDSLGRFGSHRIIEPHEECEDDIIRDVFMRNNAAYLSFAFYEKFATKFPRLRHVVQSCMYLLPWASEANRCEIVLTDVDMDRKWVFGYGSGHPNGEFGGNDVDECSLRRRLGTIRRYSMENVDIYCVENAELTEIHFLNSLLDNFKENFKRFRAKGIMLDGFHHSSNVVSKEIDNVKLCMLHGEYVPTIMFEFTTPAQLVALFENKREFRKDVIVQADIVASSAVNGEEMAPVLACLGDLSLPLSRVRRFSFGVQPITNVTFLLEPIYQTLMSAKIRRTISFYQCDFDELDVYAFAMGKFFVQDEAEDGEDYTCYKSRDKFFSICFSAGKRIILIRLRP